jgi:hypothetical protein
MSEPTIISAEKRAVKTDTGCINEVLKESLLQASWVKVEFKVL